MKEPSSDFGRALRAWRKANEMSGVALAARLKMSSTTISQVELGSVVASKSLLGKLQGVGFHWPPVAGVEPAPSQAEIPEVPVGQSRDEKSRYTRNGRTYTEAELNSRPWANNELTLRQFLDTEVLVEEAFVREQQRYAVPDLRNSTYIESFFKLRDSPANFHYYIGGERFEPLRAAIGEFMTELLANWQTLADWQQQAIKQAVDESLRVNEQWLENMDRYIDRGDISIGARLTDKVLEAFEAIALIPEPSPTPPVVRIPYQPRLGRINKS